MPLTLALEKCRASYAGSNGMLLCKTPSFGIVRIAHDNRRSIDENIETACASLIDALPVRLTRVVISDT